MSPSVSVTDEPRLGYETRSGNSVLCVPADHVDSVGTVFAHPGARQIRSEILAVGGTYSEH